MFSFGIVAIEKWTVNGVASACACLVFACSHCRAWVRIDGTIIATQSCALHTDMLMHMLFEAAQEDELANTLWRALVKRALASGAATLH